MWCWNVSPILHVCTKSFIMNKHECFKTDNYFHMQPNKNIVFVSHWNFIRELKDESLMDYMDYIETINNLLRVQFKTFVLEYDCNTWNWKSFLFTT